MNLEHAQRAAFEAWRKKIYSCPQLKRRGNFDYIDTTSAVAFDSWQAATEHAARICESLSDDANNNQCADAIRSGE